MQKHIENLVDGVLFEMKSYGLTDSTINQYRRGLYKPIIIYFNNNNDGIYSSETLEACKQKYVNLLCNNLIKQHHFQSMKRSLNYIREYEKTNTLVFTRDVNTKKYLPSKQSLELIENILSKTELKENFKYKLNSIMRKFFCFVESKDLNISSISSEVIKDFICYAHDDNSGSMEYIIYSLRVLTNYLTSDKIINTKFNFNYLVPKSNPKRIIAPFSKEEILDILASIDNSTAIGKRNYAIILLACGTGLRGIDIIKLKLSDINWKYGEISIIQSKTRNALKIPISGQISNAIADYILNGRQKSSYPNIFLRSNAPFIKLQGTGTLDKIIEAASCKAGVTKKTHRSFHSLRRSFGTWIAKEEVPITTIAQLLGHSDMDSSNCYISFDNTQLITCAMGFEDIPLNGGVFA